MTLSGEDFQKIQAGPNMIKFGIVFIKSSIQQTFWIRNDLASYISVQLESPLSEFSESYLKSQIIPPGAMAGFEICFSSSKIQTFSETIKYIINKKYEFFYPGWRDGRAC